MNETFAAKAYAGRRKRLMKENADGVTLVRAQSEIYRNGNVALRYRQASDFYYLTGLEESDAVAVLNPGSKEPFTLFLRPIDPKTTLWTGETAGLERARTVYGADAAYPLDELWKRLPRMLPGKKAVYVKLTEDWDLLRKIMEMLRPFEIGPMGRLPSAIADLRPALAEMRVRKDAHEKRLLRRAADIAVKAFVETIPEVKPSRFEYQIEADLEARYRKGGARGFSFPSIIASGNNATVLHYWTNKRRVEAGDLVLIDSGAEYEYYPSDITRTVPASGRFTKAQREIYDAVLTAQKAAVAAVRPGVTLADVHRTAARLLVKGLVKLGLLKGKPDKLLKEGALRRFYPHSTSHWMGLDVHDLGYRMVDGKPRPLEPGMVLTVEPGIYVPEADTKAPARYRGIGVRIEDDVIVTKTGGEVLTRALPKDGSAIEALMNKRALGPAAKKKSGKKNEARTKSASASSKPSRKGARRPRSRK